MHTTDEIQRFDREYTLRLDPATLHLYKRFVTEFLIYAGKSYELIAPRDIRHWLIELDKKGLSSSTRNTRLAGLKLFYRFLKEENLIEKDPTESLPLSKVEEKLPYYLKNEQLIELRSIVKNLKERAVMETLYFTGVRISELVAMEKKDINWSERSIHIPKGKRKKARIVLFTRECREHLKAYLDHRDDDLPYLFLNAYNKPLGKRTIQDYFVIYSNKLDFKLTPHTLRHTFAAHLSIKGMPLECIQTLLGHDDLQQTQYYARLYDHARKTIYDEWM